MRQWVVTPNNRDNTFVHLKLKDGIIEWVYFEVLVNVHNKEINGDDLCDDIRDFVMNYFHQRVVITEDQEDLFRECVFNTVVVDRSIEKYFPESEDFTIIISYPTEYDY